MTTPLVGILQCGHSAPEVIPTHGNYDSWFHGLLDGQGLRFRTWSVVDMEFPVEVTEAEAWLLTGSPHGAYEDFAFIPPLEDFIRQVHAAEIPMLGICFGHQVIAQALGGRVEKFQGGWQLGRKDYQIDGLGAATLNAWHQDQVLDLPPGADVIASAPGCAIAGIAVGDHVRTLQPHPEITNALLTDLIAARRGTGTYLDRDMDEAAAGARHPTDAAKLADWMGSFLRQQT